MASAPGFLPPLDHDPAGREPDRKIEHIWGSEPDVCPVPAPGSPGKQQQVQQGDRNIREDPKDRARLLRIPKAQRVPIRYPPVAGESGIRFPTVILPACRSRGHDVGFPAYSSKDGRRRASIVPNKSPEEEQDVTVCFKGSYSGKRRIFCEASGRKADAATHQGTLIPPGARGSRASAASVRRWTG